MNTKSIFTGIVFSAAACTAQAGLIVDSINVKMANSTYNARGDNDSDYAGASSAFLNGADGGCDLNVEAFTGLSYRSTCGGSKRNYGAQYTISGVNTGVTAFQFGLDWGRGGFFSLDAGGSIETSAFTDQDIWWGNNWLNSDVINFNLTTQGAFTLTLLGFEGCCDGANSARYANMATESTRLLDGFSNEPFVTSLQNTKNFQPAGVIMPMNDPSWQALEVNRVADVPTPASLPLIGLGALLMYGARRRRAKA